MTFQVIQYGISLKELFFHCHDCRVPFVYLNYPGWVSTIQSFKRSGFPSCMISSVVIKFCLSQPLVPYFGLPLDEAT